MSLTPDPPCPPFPELHSFSSPVSINHFGNLLLPRSLLILQEAKKKIHKIFKAPTVRVSTGT